MGHVLGVRGATTADANTRPAILDATEELLREVMKANALAEDDIAAIFFTTTRDLDAEFPAVAARVRVGLASTALMDAPEIPVPGDAERVIRLMMLVNTEKRKDEVVHVYLRGARKLRARGVEGTSGDGRAV